MGQDRNATIEKISQLIAGRQDVIIPKVQAAIYDHIAGQERLTCLTIVARKEGGDIVEEFAPRPPGLRYVKALTAFVRKKDFEGRTLDSVLSDGTAVKVAEVFSSEISTLAGDISEDLVPYLVRSEIFAEGIASAIVAAHKGSVPTHVKRQITTALTSSLKAALAQQVDASSIGAIKTGVAKVVGSSIVTPIGVKLAVIITRILATSLKPIIIKILSSVALKAVIAAKLKAVVIGALLGAFVKILAVKLGLSVAATTAWVLTPLVVAWLTAEAYMFPGKLAKSVSEAVAEDMRSGFHETSRTTAEMIVEMAVAQAAALVVGKFVTDESVSDIIGDILDEAA